MSINTKLLHGKFALVTGASRGIGRGIALRLAERGAAVDFNFLQNEPAALDTVARIKSGGGEAFGVQAYVAHPDELTAMVQHVQEQFAELEIYVHNALGDLLGFISPPLASPIRASGPATKTGTRRSKTAIERRVPVIRDSALQLEGGSMYSLFLEDSRRRPMATLLVLACLLLVLSPRAFSQHGKIITIDPPGTLSTVASSINEEGAIAGYYVDPSGYPQPFVRNEGGTFTTFELPGGGYVFAINEAGTITGFAPPSDGFLVSRRGTNTTLDFPLAQYTIPLSINEDGAVAGQYGDENYSIFGFIRKPNGTMIKIAPPGAYLCTVNSINDDGAATGYYYDAAGAHGFVRSKSGSITGFDVPGASLVDPQSINAHGAIAGIVYGDTGERAFVRDEQGTITTFDCLGSNDTFASSINDRGEIAGYCAPEGHYWVGFLRDKIGNIATFDLPGVVSPFAIPEGRLSIDGDGAVAGTYFDVNGTSHGFLRKP